MEEKNEEPVVDNTVGKLKVKKKMKKIKSNPDGDTATVDLKKPIEPKQDEIKEDNPVDEGVVKNKKKYNRKLKHKKKLQQ